MPTHSTLRQRNPLLGNAHSHQPKPAREAISKPRNGIASPVVWLTARNQTVDQAETDRREQLGTLATAGTLRPAGGWAALHRTDRQSGPASHRGKRAPAVIAWVTQPRTMAMKMICP